MLCTHYDARLLKAVVLYSMSVLDVMTHNPLTFHPSPPLSSTHTTHTQDDTTVVTVPHLGLTGATEQMSPEEVQKRLHLKAEELKSDTSLTEVRGHHHSNQNLFAYFFSPFLSSCPFLSSSLFPSLLLLSSSLLFSLTFSPSLSSLLSSLLPSLLFLPFSPLSSLLSSSLLPSLLLSPLSYLLSSSLFPSLLILSLLLHPTGRAGRAFEGRKNADWY